MADARASGTDISARAWAELLLLSLIWSAVFFAVAFFLAGALVFFAMSENFGKAGTRAQVQKKFNLSSNCPSASHV